MSEAQQQVDVLAELVEYFGWTHVKNDNMRASSNDIWMYYMENKKPILLRGVMGDIVPYSNKKRYPTFDKFDPFVKMEDAQIVLNSMRKKGWFFFSTDKRISGSRKIVPAMVEVRFSHPKAYQGMATSMINDYPQAITLAAIDAMRKIKNANTRQTNSVGTGPDRKGETSKV